MMFVVSFNLQFKTLLHVRNHLSYFTSSSVLKEKLKFVHQVSNCIYSYDSQKRTNWNHA